jgi:alkylation response protein AidB-like acyl-CoA dehydrogenase
MGGGPVVGVAIARPGGLPGNMEGELSTGVPMSDTMVTLSEADADAFRQRCREFLDANATDIPGAGRSAADDRGKALLDGAKKFQKALADAGLAGLIYPKEFGGQGLSRTYDRIWREEYGRYPDMTSELTISHGMCLPVLNDFGTTDQKNQFLAKNISGEQVWCQMFSEPGAGSDVASLQTRAERDGDEWVINGQKVWTTLAHLSDYGILNHRTNPDVPKHAGISMFIVDMKDPAVEIRAIHQIDGGMHFNEVFFTNLHIPADWLVGELNNGWNQATAMLMYERVAIGTGSSTGVSHPNADRMIEEATKRDRISDPVLRQGLMRLYSEEFAKSLVAMRTRAELKAGRAPGPGGSLGKLHGARIAPMMRSLTGQVFESDLLAYAPGEAVKAGVGPFGISSFARRSPVAPADQKNMSAIACSASREPPSTAMSPSAICGSAPSADPRLTAPRHCGRLGCPSTTSRGATSGVGGST